MTAIPLPPEAIDSILSAMQIGMELAKKKNKEKYTPKNIKRTDVYGHKKRANQIAHRFQSRNPFEIVRGLNVILVDAP